MSEEAAQERSRRLLAAVVAREAEAEAREKEVHDVPNLQAIYERLVKAFGWGDDKVRRKEFYTNLVRTIGQHGQAVLDLVDEAAQQSVGTADKGRYFCRAVIAKLREKGYSAAGVKKRDPGW